MKVTVDGQVYEHNRRRLLNSDAIIVKRHTRMTIAQWNQGLEDDDPEAVKALVFLLKMHAGENPDWDTLDFDHAQLVYGDSDAEPPADEPAPKDGDAPTS